MLRKLLAILYCWHEAGWPITSEGQTYRPCVHCGARRGIKAGTFEMEGDWYRPAVTAAAAEVELPELARAAGAI